MRRIAVVGLAAAIVAMVPGAMSRPLAGQTSIQSLAALPRLVSTTTITEGRARRVNAVGQVLVVRGEEVFPSVFPHQTFVWSRADGLVEIVDPTGLMVRGTAINRHGQVVGDHGPLAGPYWWVFIWSKTGGFFSLWLTAITNVSPAAVNDAGSMVGPATDQYMSFRWNTDHSSFWGNPLNGLNNCTSSAPDISQWGETVGAASGGTRDCPPGGGRKHAYLWRWGTQPKDLRTLGGTDSAAVAINDRGQVAGWNLTSAGVKRAIIWSAARGMRSLGTLGGRWSYAVAINNLGHVAGVSETSSGFAHAFFWSSGSGIVDIGTGVPAAMNDLGQVVGSTVSASRAAAWFWSPIDGRTNFAQNARVLDINDRGQAVGEKKTLTPPVYATLWQMRVIVAETINWYEARTAVLRYGGAISSAQAATYTKWIANARAALAAGNTAQVTLYVEKLKAALGEP